MEELLLAPFLADTAIAAVIDRSAHWDKLPDGVALPAIIFHEIFGDDIHHMGGRLPLVGTLVQTDCWATTKAGAVLLRRLVIARYDALKATPLKCFPERRHSSWSAADGPGADRLSDLYRASVDARVWHLETAS